MLSTNIPALFKRIFPTNPWKILAILLALLNLKSLPFAWHLRLLHGLYAHIYTSRRRLKLAPGPQTIFQPLITSSRSGPLECDYNLHKSNSTYFSDFDVGRLHLLIALCGHGIDVTRKELAVEMPQEKAGLIIALGGVAVNFRKEIKPFEKFEVWTRILSWDSKWIYLVGHFVKPGTAKVGRYTLQPWKKGKQNSKEGDDGKEEAGPKPVIFASGIAKYVFKKGRLTIPPERILRASRLLPPKLEDRETPLVSSTPDLAGASVEGEVATASASAVEELTPENADEFLAASMKPKEGGDVEEERVRGMQIAELYNGLDKLNGAFPGNGEVILGSY